jgi:hypothetical protein
MARERCDALFVGRDGFFNARRVQLTHLASRHALPAIYGGRDFAARRADELRGTLHTIRDAWEYMTAISKEREQRRHWQQVRKMILEEEANMAAVSWQLRLAVLKDAKLDVTKMGT